MEIIVFDSGIGGFSILNEILRQKLPIDIRYVCDQAHFPYGSKSQEWLESRLLQFSHWAKSYSPVAVVIACNTATVAGIGNIRQFLNCPVVGVEPVIKPLASYSSALVLSTQATADSPRTKELINMYGSHISVYVPQDLAKAIENSDSERVKNIIASISRKVRAEKIESIGLSCTHYPLVIDELRQSMPDVHIYDPSVAVVTQLKKILEEKSVDIPSSRRLIFQTTGPVVRFNKQISQYIGEGHQASKVSI